MNFSKKDYDTFMKMLENLASNKFCSDFDKQILNEQIVFFKTSGFKELYETIQENIGVKDLIKKVQINSSIILNYGRDNVVSYREKDIVADMIKDCVILKKVMEDRKQSNHINRYFYSKKKTVDKNYNGTLSYMSDAKGKIEREISVLEKVANTFKNTMETSTNNLQSKLENVEAYENNIIERYNKIYEQQKNFENDLNNQQESFRRKINEQIDDLQDGVYRQELAGYFLKERNGLKGEANISTLLLAGLLYIIFQVEIIDFINAISLDNENTKIILNLFFVILIILGCSFLVEIIKDIFIKDSWTTLRSNTKLWLSRFFKKKSKNIFWMFTPYWAWLSATFLGMYNILNTAYKFFGGNISANYLEPSMFFQRIPLFMIWIWFTWFCSKQFSYTKQVCDEYEYKYVLSMSYLSYRNEAKNISDGNENEAIIVSLLDSVIKNIATSPVQAVKSDCHTPFSEVVNAMKTTVTRTKSDDVD